MGINKVLCVFEGIPLWSSAVTSKENENQTDAVIVGGFLSAINSFALQTENNTIKNLTIGDSFWTITKIHNQDNFFLAVHSDAFPDDKEKALKVNAIEKFIVEILSEFTRLFPPSFFKTPPSSMSVFRNIKEFTMQKIDAYNSLLGRYQEGLEKIGSVSEKSCQLTEFKCGLCNKMIHFNICDETTYFSKTAHQVFFGAELSTYKVGHYDQDDVHVNSALVDKKGVLYEVIDAYSVKAKELVRQEGLSSKAPIYLLRDGRPPLMAHKYIERMVILDKTKPWIMEIIGASPDDAIPLGLQIISKTEEFEEIYNKNNGSLSLLLNEKEFHVWNSGPIIVSASFKNDKIGEMFDRFATYLSHIPVKGEEWLIKRDRINVALRIFENATIVKDDIPLLQRIISDDLLDIKLKIKYNDHIPQIIDRLGREFILAKDILNPLLHGEITILHLIETNYVNRFRELLSLVDFMNRRNLVS